MTDRSNGEGASLGLSPEEMRQLADAATDSLLARLAGLRDDVPCVVEVNDGALEANGWSSVPVLSWAGGVWRAEPDEQAWARMAT